MTKWKIRARSFKSSAYAVAVAIRDPRTPWHVRAVAALVVAYALSPIDLIPDFIPLLGYLDDLILLPLGIALVVRLLPSGVWSDAQRRCAETGAGDGQPKWIGGAIVVTIWVISAAGAGLLTWRWMS